MVKRKKESKTKYKKKDRLVPIFFIFEEQGLIYLYQ